MTANTTPDPIYVMGYSGHERERLIQQAGLLGPLSERFLRDAGIAPGMRVLDVGCGVGDVSFLCSALVGPAGNVVGVDRDPAVITRARQRLQDLGTAGVTFVESDYRTLPDQPPFDAVIGRAVLMYAADPAAALRSLLPQVRPGGIVAFQEFDFTHVTAFPTNGVQQQLKDWWSQLGERTGIELHMGYKLFPVYRAAGLPDPAILAETIIGGGQEFAGYAYLADVFRSVLPLLEQLGVATAAEVDIDTLADRLRDATVAGGGVIALQSLVGAVSRKT